MHIIYLEIYNLMLFVSQDYLKLAKYPTFLTCAYMLGININAP